MDGDNWKWWYFVVAGLLIGAYGVYEFTELRIGKGIGSEILAVLCVAIGLFSWKTETAKNAKSSEPPKAE